LEIELDDFEEPEMEWILNQICRDNNGTEAPPAAAEANNAGAGAPPVVNPGGGAAPDANPGGGDPLHPASAAPLVNVVNSNVRDVIIHL